MIKIQTLDYNWLPLGVDDLELEVLIAEQFINDIKDSINTQKYNFAPLSPRYLAYKYKRGLSLHTWEATSQLKNTLSYTVKGNTIIIGWDKSLVHKNSNSKLYKIAMYLEYGTSVIPPRPLFRNTLRDFDLSKFNLSKVQSGDFSTKKSIVKSGIFDSKPTQTNININNSIKKSFLSKLKNKANSIFNLFKRGGKH
jgi:hypothetical protein